MPTVNTWNNSLKVRGLKLQDDYPVIVYDIPNNDTDVTDCLDFLTFDEIYNILTKLEE